MITIARDDRDARWAAASALRQARGYTPAQLARGGTEGWSRRQLYMRAARRTITFYLSNLAEPSDPISHIRGLQRAASALNRTIAIEFQRRRG